MEDLARRIGLPGHIHPERRIEDSGSAELFLGRDSRRGRTVVIKVVRGTERLASLQSEARALARVQHCAIPEVIAVGSAADLAWIVTDHADQGSLADRLAGLDPDQPRSEGDAEGIESKQMWRWLSDVADALAAAHRAGVVHGDVSPSNILLRTNDGGDVDAYLADFGSSAMADQTSPRGGHTPRFAAPERRRGSGPSESSDVFGLCATALHCLEEAGIPIPSAAERILGAGVMPKPDRRPSLIRVQRCLQKASRRDGRSGAQG